MSLSFLSAYSFLASRVDGTLACLKPWYCTLEALTSISGSETPGRWHEAKRSVHYYKVFVSCTCSRSTALAGSLRGLMSLMFFSGRPYYHCFSVPLPTLPSVLTPSVSPWPTIPTLPIHPALHRDYQHKPAAYDFHHFHHARPVHPNLASSLRTYSRSSESH